MLNKKIVIILIESGYFTLKEAVYLTTSLNKSLSFGEYATCGLLSLIPSTSINKSRFQLWYDICLTTDVRKELYLLHRGMNLLEFYRLNCGEYLDPETQYIGQTGEIMRDVKRTFPAEAYFQERCAPLMTRVLCTIASARPDVGYCQGMNFVSGLMVLCRLSQEYDIESVLSTDDEYTLLHKLDNQNQGHNTNNNNNSNSSSNNNNRRRSSGGWFGFVESNGLKRCKDANDNWLEFTSDEALKIESDVFWIMMGILAPSSRLCMTGHWSPGVPKMRLRSYQIDRFLSWRLPALHTHLDTVCLSAEVIASQWLIPVFSYTLPLHLTLDIWDYIFIGGWSAAFRVMIALLSAAEEVLLKQDIESMSQKMRTLDWNSMIDKKIDIIMSNIKNNSDGDNHDSILPPRLSEHSRKALVLAHGLESRTGNSDDSITLPTQAISNDGLRRLQEDYASEIIAWATEGGVDNSSERRSRWFRIFSSKKSKNKNKKKTSGSRDSNDLHVESVTTLGWKQRYGTDVTVEEKRAISAVIDELENNQTQVHQDKSALQTRISQACDECKDARRGLDDARSKLERNCLDSLNSPDSTRDSIDKIVNAIRNPRSLFPGGKKKSGSGASASPSDSLDGSSPKTDTSSFQDEADSVLAWMSRLEEAELLRDILCEQMQVIVENAQKQRSQTLLDLAEAFG